MPTLCWRAWSHIGASPQVLNWILEGVPLPFLSVPSPCNLPNNSSTRQHKLFVTQEVARLEKAGFIQKISAADVVCVHLLQVAPKKTPGKFRLILDCRWVNKFIDCPKFKQPGIEEVVHQIQTSDVLVSLDLKDGFHHIVIVPYFWRFLCFQWRGQFFCWRVLLFGVKCAPFYFYKILRPVISHLRNSDVRSTVFVDDFFLMLERSLACAKKLFALRVLADLGWRVNWPKCDLSETTQCDFVGYRVHSQGPHGPWIQVLPHKVKKLKRLVRNLLHNPQVSARRLVRFTGQCIAMMRAVVPAPLLLRSIFRVLSQRQTWDSILTLDPPSFRICGGGAMLWSLGMAHPWKFHKFRSGLPPMRPRQDGDAWCWTTTTTWSLFPRKAWQGALGPSPSLTSTQISGSCSWCSEPWKHLDHSGKESVCRYRATT